MWWLRGYPMKRREIGLKEQGRDIVNPTRWIDESSGTKWRDRERNEGASLSVEPKNGA